MIVLSLVLVKKKKKKEKEQKANHAGDLKPRILLLCPLYLLPIFILKVTPLNPSLTKSLKKLLLYSEQRGERTLVRLNPLGL